MHIHLRNIYKLSLYLFGIILISTNALARKNNILFIENKGQWDAPFIYKGTNGNADFFLEKTGITYVVGDEHNLEKIHDYKELRLKEAPTLYYHAYKLEILNANPNAKIVGADRENYGINYFLGADKSKWQRNITPYHNVSYYGILPKIDLLLNSVDNQLEYSFVVNPGADVEDIKFTYKGADNLQLKDGQLIIKTSVGNVMEAAPIAFQEVNGIQKPIKCAFVLSNNILQFQIKDKYDPSLPLLIDPTINFATLTGSAADNWGFTATYDKKGNFYAGGIALGINYPTSTGAFQTTYGGGNNATSHGIACDIAITKFNPQGNAILYSTYLGGSDNEMPHSMIVDSLGNLIIEGKSFSSNYPTTSGAFSTSLSGTVDFIISKLDSTGTQLLASTFVGGSGIDAVNGSASFYVMGGLKHNYGDDSRSEVIVDRQNNIYITGSTQSSNFPVTSNAFKSSLSGNQDGVVFKMNATLTSMLWGSYVGGSDTDAAYVMALDTAQKYLYVGGGTKSTDMHSSAMTGWHTSNSGGIDGYILKINNSGTYALLKGTYIGTSAYDQVYGLRTDHENAVYIMGQTLGSFPVTVTYGSAYVANSRQFLMKLDSNISTNVYSTVWGTGASTDANISPVAFMVDTCENVYISGWGGVLISNGSTTTGLPVTTDAFQSSTDGNDFYFIVFNHNANSLLYASFFGSSGKEEHVDGGTSRFDPNGVVYQAICASCGNGSAFPATSGAYATTKGSNNCNLGAVKISFNYGGVSALAQANPNASGCVPFTVNFENESANATSYYWDFGDGSTSTQTSPSHTYTTVGTYQIMLAVYNPNSCKERDTTYLTVVAKNDTVHNDFNIVKLDSCDNMTISITNNSTYIAGSTHSLLWDFGDGTTSTVQNPGQHSYTSAGTYQVSLTITDTNACNSPSTVTKDVVFNPFNISAHKNSDTTLCQYTTLYFSGVAGDTSANTTYQWTILPSGQTFTTSSINYAFNNVGTYQIRLVVMDATSCNKIDSASFSIVVQASPTASFTITPSNIQSNTPITFNNASSNATNYLWDFGDGNNTTETSPTHTYGISGTYNACLTAYNAIGCSNKICRQLTIQVVPVADLPTAFSPNGDGENDVLYVRGYGISQIDLKIFNRWGQLIFETKDLNTGWDGTYKGKPQEMEAYAYSLDVIFNDASTKHQQGNVTLLR